jgi:hypothetical protein
LLSKVFHWKTFVLYKYIYFRYTCALYIILYIHICMHYTYCSLFILLAFGTPKLRVEFPLYLPQISSRWTGSPLWKSTKRKSSRVGPWGSIFWDWFPSLDSTW